MLSLLGSALGFAGSALPAVTEIWKNKSNQKFELERMKVQAELSKAGFDHEIRAHEVQAADKEHERLIQHDIAISRGSGVITALQRSVRPVITYAFFLLFIIIELILLRQAIVTGMEVAEAIQILWDDQTKAIFAAIISFWFGTRAIDKARK